MDPTITRKARNLELIRTRNGRLSQDEFLLPLILVLLRRLARRAEIWGRDIWDVLPLVEEYLRKHGLLELRHALGAEKRRPKGLSQRENGKRFLVSNRTGT